MPDVMLDDYGAEGDGKHDDAKALERAVKAAKGGEIALSPGKRYRLSYMPEIPDGMARLKGAYGASISVDSDPS
jgi:hypothetical protein